LENKLRQKIQQFPWPIAKPLQQAISREHDPVHRIDATCFTVYQATRFTALALFCDLLSNPKVDSADWRNVLAEHLEHTRRPLWNSWAKSLIDLVILAESDIRVISLLGVAKQLKSKSFSKILRMRNRLAHPTAENIGLLESESEDLLHHLLEVVSAFDFLANWKLWSRAVDGGCTLLRGVAPTKSDGSIALTKAEIWIETGELTLALPPWALSGDHKENAYFYNGFQRVDDQHVAEYLGVVSCVYKATSAWQEFANLTTTLSLRPAIKPEQVSPWFVVKAAERNARRRIAQLNENEPSRSEVLLLRPKLAAEFESFLNQSSDSNQRGLIVVGHGGAGKTTFLASQVEAMLREESKFRQDQCRNLVVYLPGSNFGSTVNEARGKTTIDRTILDSLGVWGDPVLSLEEGEFGGISTVEELLDTWNALRNDDLVRDRRVVFVFDAINEFRDSENLFRRAISILELSQRYSWLRCVIGVRTEWLSVFESKLGPREHPLVRVRNFLHEPTYSHVSLSGRFDLPAQREVIPALEITEYSMEEAIANYRTRQSYGGCTTSWETLTDEVRRMVRNPLRMRLFHDLFRNKQASKIANVNDLFRKCVVDRSQSVQTLKSSIGLAVSVMLEDLNRENAVLTEPESLRLREAWLAVTRDSRERRLQFDPMESLVHEGIFVRRVSDERQLVYSFLHQAIGDFCIYDHLRQLGNSTGQWRSRLSRYSVFAELHGAFRFLLQEWADSQRLQELGALLKHSAPWVHAQTASFFSEKLTDSENPMQTLSQIRDQLTASEQDLCPEVGKSIVEAAVLSRSAVPSLCEPLLNLAIDIFEKARDFTPVKRGWHGEALTRLAEMQARTDLLKAEQTALHAVKLLRKLNDSRPDIPSVSIWLIESMRVLGDVYSLLPERERSANNSYVAATTQVIDYKGPWSFDYYVQKARTFHSLGLWYRRKSNLREAWRVFLEGSRIWESVIKSDSSNLSAVVAYCESQIELFDVAISFSPFGTIPDSREPGGKFEKRFTEEFCRGLIESPYQILAGLDCNHPEVTRMFALVLIARGMFLVNSEMSFPDGLRDLEEALTLAKGNLDLPALDSFFLSRLQECSFILGLAAWARGSEFDALSKLSYLQELELVSHSTHESMIGAVAYQLLQTFESGNQSWETEMSKLVIQCLEERNSDIQPIKVAAMLFTYLAKYCDLADTGERTRERGIDATRLAIELWKKDGGTSEEVRGRILMCRVLEARMLIQVGEAEHAETILQEAAKLAADNSLSLGPRSETFKALWHWTQRRGDAEAAKRWYFEYFRVNHSMQYANNALRHSMLVQLPSLMKNWVRRRWNRFVGIDRTYSSAGLRQLFCDGSSLLGYWSIPKHNWLARNCVSLALASVTKECDRGRARVESVSLVVSSVSELLYYACKNAKTSKLSKSFLLDLADRAESLGSHFEAGIDRRPIDGYPILLLYFARSELLRSLGDNTEAQAYAIRANEVGATMLRFEKSDAASILMCDIAESCLAFSRTSHDRSTAKHFTLRAMGLILAGRSRFPQDAGLHLALAQAYVQLEFFDDARSAALLAIKNYVVPNLSESVGEISNLHREAARKKLGLQPVDIRAKSVICEVAKRQIQSLQQRRQVKLEKPVTDQDSTESHLAYVRNLMASLSDLFEYYVPNRMPVDQQVMASHFLMDLVTSQDREILDNPQLRGTLERVIRILNVAFPGQKNEWSFALNE